MNYLPHHPSAFGLQEIPKTSSLPFKTPFLGNNPQETLSKESLSYHTNNKQANNNKSFKPTSIPSGNRAQTSTHGKHSSYQEHHRGDISAESSLRLPTLPSSAIKNNLDDKTNTMQSPKANESNGLDYTGKFASFSQQKKRTIRVQSKNKFPSDFFESNQPEDSGFQTFNEKHAISNSQQNDDFPLYYSSSTNKPYTSSNPMKFSLPIPSPQVHFDIEDSKQQTKLEETKEVTENKNKIIKQQAIRVHSATLQDDNTINSVNRNNNNMKQSQTKDENELYLNNTLQRQITNQTPLIGQIFTKKSSTSKNNNNNNTTNLKHQISISVPSPQETPAQLQSKQPLRLSSPKDKLLPPRLASPKNIVSSNPQDSLKTFNSNKLTNLDLKTDHKPLGTIEQSQKEYLESNPNNKGITDEVLEQLCTSVSGKRIQINNQLIPQHPQSSHVLQRPKQNQNNKSGSNIITNPPSNNIKINNITATKRMLNYEVKMTSNNLHEAINKNAFSCKSVEKRERQSLMLPHSKERPVESLQKQPTETSNISNNQDEKSTMLKRNLSGQRIQGIIVKNASEQQQNQQNSSSQSNQIIKSKGTTSNIDFSNFKIPLNTIGKKIKEGGAVKVSETGKSCSDTDNTIKFKSSTLEGNSNKGQKIATESESQQSRKQKQRPQSMKVTEEMKNKMLIDLTENVSDQQLKADKQCQHMNVRNNNQAEKQEDLLSKIMPSSPPPPVPLLRSAQSHEIKTNAQQQQQADRSLLNMTNSFEKEEEGEIDPISENYNKTANFTSMQDIGMVNSTPVTGRLKQMKSQPKIAVNLKECEKYKPFLIRKVSSQCSMRTKQQSVQSTGSPNSSSSLQTFIFDFNRNYSGSTNPGGPSQVSSPTLLASNEQFNSHEFSFSHQ